MAESLKEKTAKGLFWGGLNNMFQQFVGLVFGIILGNLLSRDDYGVMAMIMVFSLIASALQNSGFTAALTNLQRPTDRDYNSVFWFNIIMAFSCYTVLFFSAPLIAAYYHEPRLVSLCRYAFLSFVIASFSTAQSAWLLKRFMARQMAKAGMIAILMSSLTGTVMALCGMAYWSLATQALVYVLVNTLLVWHYSSWRPTFHIDLRPAFSMFGFSSKVLITIIASHINNNIMNVMLGRHFTTQDTGDFSQANQWSQKSSSLIQGMLRQVDQPVLVDLHDERERQLAVLRKITRFTAFISFPFLLGLALVSHEFILLTIGEKWATSASMLPWLCVSGAFIPLSTLLADSIVSQGRSNIYMWCTLALGALQILLMSLLWPYGIHTMIYAFVCTNVAWVGIWFFFVHRLMRYQLLSFLKDILPFALAALAVMTATYFITLPITTLWLLLFVRIIVAAGLYYLVMRLSGAKILEETMQFVLSKGKKVG